MLDGYWLFGEPNTVIARDPARLGEYISLFKHACLFQREVNLSDLMVIASPNFRLAYRSDAEFRELVASDWVNFWYLHRKGPRHNEGPMDLVDVKDFHHQNGLYSQEEYRFFSNDGSDEYLRDLQRKKKPTTLKEADGTLRDPIFTQRVLNTFDCAYLHRHLGDYQRLFAEFTHELQAELAANETPLGAIHFEAGLKKDGTYRWGFPTIIDRLYQRVGDDLSADQRKTLIDGGSDRDVKVYKLSTALDDVTLYRHLDFKTIEAIRSQNAGLDLFKVCTLSPPPPGMTEEASIREQTRLADDFAEILVEYRRNTERELSQRFSQCCKRSLSRTVLLTIGTSLSKLAVDAVGATQPNPTVAFGPRRRPHGISDSGDPDDARAARYGKPTMPQPPF